MSELTIDKLVKIYRKIKAAKEVITEKYEKEVASLDEQMAEIKTMLQEHCKVAGVEGGKTEYGTFSRILKTKLWTNDWVGFGKFVVENNLPDLFQKSINQKNLTELLEQQPELIIPGLNVDRSYEIRISPPSKSKSRGPSE